MITDAPPVPLSGWHRILPAEPHLVAVPCPDCPAGPGVGCWRRYTPKYQQPVHASRRKIAEAAEAERRRRHAEVEQTRRWLATLERTDAGLYVLPGRADPSGRLLLVWCAWCQRDHIHGRHDNRTPDCPTTASLFAEVCSCPPGSGDGPRVEHCHTDRPGSPFFWVGYIAREVRP